MAYAKFHSLRGENSALLMVKANKFVFKASPVYVPKDAVANREIGEEFEIPDGFKLADMVGEDGVVRTTKDGEPLKVLAY